MKRGLAWLIGIAVLSPFMFWQIVPGAPSQAPLPVLYTLGGDFTLNSTLGRPLSLQALRGEVVLLNFGYTGCPDVCPTALARMRDSLALVKALEVDGEQVQSLFVTLDPELDTLDRLGPYLRFFDPTFIGLTGSTDAVAATASRFKVFYEKSFFADSEDTTGPIESGYSISHSSHIYLLDRTGQVRATFAEGVPVSSIAAAIQRLLAEPAQTMAGNGQSSRRGSQRG